MDEVNLIDDLSVIKFKDKDTAAKEGLYVAIGKQIDDEYVKNVKEQVQCVKSLAINAKNFKVVYTPLHGAGNKLVRRVLEEAGFADVLVEEQEEPDGNFPTASYPNPEDSKVFELGIRLAVKENADVVIATDPDCDRIGVAVKNDKGEFVTLTGNMTGALLTEFILKSQKEAGRLPDDAVVIKTIVTTNMVKPICDEYGAELMEVLTGFKFIGGKIKEFSETGGHSYVFGFEESYGYLAGTYARDKDAVVAAMLICEMAASLKADSGKTLYGGLMDLYKKYGYYKDEVKSITLAGSTGLKKMADFMLSLRSNPPESMGDISVTVWADYKKGKRLNVNAGIEEDTGLPISDALKYELADGSYVAISHRGQSRKLSFISKFTIRCSLAPNCRQPMRRRKRKSRRCENR
jgi:phosphoglucomutase